MLFISIYLNMYTYIYSFFINILGLLPPGLPGQVAPPALGRGPARVLRIVSHQTLQIHMLVVSFHIFEADK